MSISNGIVSIKIHDKVTTLIFEIVNFPFLDVDVPPSPSYGVSRTQYTQTGHWHTGKCIYWKYVVEAELSKRTFLED